MQRLLGEEGRLFLPLLHGVAEHLAHHEYSYAFLDNQLYDELLQRDIATAMQFYWSEILYRAHMAAATSLFRSQRWLSAATHAAETNNILAFAACWRGFMEGAADTFDGVGIVAETLANHHRTIRLALTGKMTKVALANELENTLIHFLVARKIAPKESAPDSHRAKQARQYFDSLKNDRDPLLAFYKDLCEMTHSSMASIDVFLATLPNGEMRLQPEQGAALIENLLGKHQTAIPTLFFCGLNSPLLILKVLNAFPVESIHTPVLDSINFNHLPIGRRINDALLR